MAGVFTDYRSDQGIVMMSRRTYERHWEDRGVSSLGLVARPGVEVERLVASLRAEAGEGSGLLIRSNRALREASLQVFDRTFAITAVLRTLAIVVAVVGILSALMAQALERARELAVLRAQGLTPAELWGVVLGQTGLMGAIAGLLAIPVGVGLAVVLVRIINRRAFGWTLDLAVAPGILVDAVLVAVGAALLAGIYPAWRMACTPPALALRDE